MTKTKGIWYVMWLYSPPPPPTHTHLPPLTDQTNLTVTLDRQQVITEANKQAWLELQSKSHDQGPNDHMINTCKLTNQDMLHLGSDGCFSTMKENRMATFICLSQALRWCSAGRDLSLPPLSPETKMSGNSPLVPEVLEASHIQILVTGSLHLVGATMNILGCTVDDL